MLSDIGVHPSYKYLENQGYFSSNIFKDKHKVAYEFYFYRCLWLFLSMISDMIRYCIDNWPKFIMKIPNIIEAAEMIHDMIDQTHKGWVERSRRGSE